MISRVWAKNYKSLADIDVDLAPITVLVGPNGSGKSNLVDLFRFIQESCRLGLDAAIVNRHGMSAVRRWSAKGRPFDVEVGLTVAIGDDVYMYGFALGSERRGEYSVKREEALVTSRSGQHLARYEIRDGAWATPVRGLVPELGPRTLALPLVSGIEPFDALYRYLAGFSFYNIHPRALAQPQKPGNTWPLLEDGANLASVLREMLRAGDTSLLQRLRQSLKTVLPDVVDLIVNQSGGFLITYLLHEMTPSDRAKFDLSQESDGTLRVLGILSALYQQPAPTLLALEEPELTIHPGALRTLWEEIEAVADRSQVVVTTHSPDLLDLCLADQLRVVEKRNGSTMIGLVEAGQKRAIQDRLFAPGELLRAEGLRLAQGELIE